MTKLLSALLLVLATHLASAAALVQVTVCPWQPPTGNLNVLAACSLASPATPGNMVIVEVAGEGIRTVSSVADTDLSSYNTAGSDASSGYRIAVRYVIAGSADAGQNVLVTLSGNSGDNYQVILREVSGLASDQSGLQAGNVETSSGTTHTGSSLTPPGSTDYALVTAVRGNRSYTEDTDFTAATMGTNRTYSGYIEDPVGTVQIEFTSDSATTALIKSLIFVGESAGGSIIPQIMNNRQQQAY